MVVVKGVTRLVRRLRNTVTMTNKFSCVGTARRGI
jgi:hypothetical protein